LKSDLTFEEEDKGIDGKSRRESTRNNKNVKKWLDSDLDINNKTPIKNKKIVTNANEMINTNQSMDSDNLRLSRSGSDYKIEKDLEMNKKVRDG